MAINNKAIKAPIFVSEDTRFTSRANVSVKDDDFYAVFISETVEKVILDNNVSITNKDDANEFITAICLNGSAVLYSNNVAKTISATNILNNNNDSVTAYGINGDSVFIGGKRYLQTIKANATNSGKNGAIVEGITAMAGDILCTAQVCKNISVSAMATGSFSYAKASAFAAKDLPNNYTEDTYGHIMFNNGISGNITASATSSTGGATAFAFDAENSIIIFGEMSGKINVKAKGKSTDEQVTASGLDAGSSLALSEFNSSITISAQNTGSTFAYGMRGHYIELSCNNKTQGKINAIAQSSNGDANTFGIRAYDRLSIMGDMNIAISASASSVNNDSWGYGFCAEGDILIDGNITKNITVSAQNVRSTESGYSTAVFGINSNEGNISMNNLDAKISVSAANEGNANAYCCCSLDFSAEDITKNMSASAINSEHYGRGESNVFLLYAEGYIRLNDIQGKHTATATNGNATACGFFADVFAANDMSEMTLNVKAKTRNGEAFACGIDAETGIVGKDFDLNLGNITVNASAGKNEDATAFGIFTNGRLGSNEDSFAFFLNTRGNLSGNITVTSNGNSYGIVASSIDYTLNGLDLKVSGSKNAYGLFLAEVLEDESSFSELNISNSKITATLIDKNSDGYAYAIYGRETADSWGVYAHNTINLKDQSVVTGIVDLGNGTDYLSIENGSKLKGALIDVEFVSLDIGNSNKKNTSLWDITNCEDMTQSELIIDFDYGMTGTYLLCTKQADVSWSEAIADNITLDLEIDSTEFDLNARENIYSDGFYDYELEINGNKMLLTVTEKNSMK